ncbi:MAG: fumarylacetoacetate hydrolase family protein [Roseovarius sp.]
MKLASLADGTPDGQLAVVSDDLARCTPLPGRTLQGWLDAPFDLPPPGNDPFNPARALAPLPRAFGFLDGSAYVNHVALVRRARGADMPDSFWSDPLMYQGASDAFLPATAPLTGDPVWGIDFEAEIAVVTGPVPQGVTPCEAAGMIRLVMLLNDVSLRALIPGELAKGFGFVQSKPPSACSPVAVTPDALPGWDGGRLHGVLKVDLKRQAFGRADAGVDMTFDFPTLIAHAARTRPLAAGTVIGSGTVSNRDKSGGPGQPVAQGGRGYSCIAEQRMVETIETGAARTPFLAFGDTVKIWMEDEAGQSIFGAIHQSVLR